jgi:hypothetical protein
MGGEGRVKEVRRGEGRGKKSDQCKLLCLIPLEEGEGGRMFQKTGETREEYYLGRGTRQRG